MADSMVRVGGKLTPVTTRHLIDGQLLPSRSAWSTDFSEHAIGSSPADWTSPWTSTGLTRSIVDIGTGEKALRITTSGSGGRRMSRWTTVPTSSAFNVLTRFRLLADGTSSADIGLAVRVRGAAGVETGYMGRETAADRIVSRYDSGTPTTLGPVLTGAVAPRGGTWRWARLNVDAAGVVSYRVWDGAVTDEPTTWDITATDATPLDVGGAGIFRFNGGDSSTEVAYFAVGVNGATAPAPTSAPATLPATPWAAHPTSPTTMTEESSYLSNLASLTNRVRILQVGTSAQGRPIRAVIVGPPRTRDQIRAANVVMVMGSHHGDEWAGREAIFEDMRAHAISGGDETVVYLPTVSPDSVVTPDRELANGVDPNRLWRSSGENAQTDGTPYEPEQQAVRQAILLYHPRLILDTHEYSATADGTTRIHRFDPGTIHPTGTPTAVISAAQGVLSAMKTAATNAGYSIADYTGTIPDDGATQAWKRGGIPSVFTETPQLSPDGLAGRRAQHLTSLGALRQWIRSNAASLASVASTAAWYNGFTPTVTDGSTADQPPAQEESTNTTGGTGGPLTDQTFVSYTDPAGTTSTVHVFAAGLDWTRPVGAMIYGDGSGEFGLNNPTSSYLLAGAAGLVAVAKKHNLLLITPMAPGDGLPDGGGVGWYDTSFDGTTVAQKTAWSRAVIDRIYSFYNLDRTRVVLGGYSSGAQWLTEYFGPTHASQIMADGVAVAISYGGSPKVTAQHTAAHRSAVPYVWDTGDQDPAWTDKDQYGVQAGFDWYTAAGFATSLTLVAGEDHYRDGQFAGVMDREAANRMGTVAQVGAYTATRTSTGMTWSGAVSGTTSITVRASSAPLSGGQQGFYITVPVTSGQATATFTSFSPGIPYYWQVEAVNPNPAAQGGHVIASGSVPAS